MSHTPHELAEEFPDDAERIHAREERDARFRRVCDEYHYVNRAECGDEPSDGFQETDPRERRMTLGGQAARRLSDA